MSGGSYNYLYCHVNGLGAQREDIERMEERLRSGGYYEAARSTREALRLLDGADRIAESLSGVWQAVEWADSGDYGEDDVQEAVAKFTPWPPPGDAAPKPSERPSASPGPTTKH